MLKNPSPLTRENVLIVVPAFNEENSIEFVVNSLVGGGWSVLVVSDGSTDDTAVRAKRCGVNVLEIPINLGVGGALRTGFKFAIRNGYQAVVQFDADGQHRESEIIKLIEDANSKDSDMVLGSRFRSEGTTMILKKPRILAMRILAKLASRAAKTPISDATSGFRLIRGQLLTEFSRHFAVNYLGDTFEAIVSAGRSRYHISEVSTSMSDRTHGDSTASSLMALLYSMKCLITYFLRIGVSIAPKTNFDHV